jgi:hypothetical protein
MFLGLAAPLLSFEGSDLALEGISVTPHTVADAMRYATPRDPELGALVQMFLKNEGTATLTFDANSPIRIDGKSPDDLLGDGDWAWHDFPSAWTDSKLEIPTGAIVVWTFNGKSSAWGVGRDAKLAASESQSSKPRPIPFRIEKPSAWISSVTFLSTDQSVYPDSMVVHLANEHQSPLRITGYRLWLPKTNSSWRVMHPQPIRDEFESWPSDRVLGAGQRAIMRVRTDRLPLSYGVVEVQLKDDSGKSQSLWAHLRIKREVFDISGGWVQGGRNAPTVMSFEPFLKTLKRLYVNTAHLADQIPGYTDQTAPGGLYDRYPLKYFNALTPEEKYEKDDVLPRVHAVEFLGEPQYGGGRPVPPMEVWQKLAPYQASKLPTTLTHSEEKIWRYYAGLSDFPHYDAYRVCAPSPDAWWKYDRWDGKKVGWGAPLETIGDMSRSLRDLNRPKPTAYWSQGPADGWGPVWGRKRTSPTPDEIRLQAYHALSSRITSLYWFNLSLKSLLKYPDTMSEIARVGREIRLLDDFYLQGDAYQYYRSIRDGKLDWDLASLASPEGMLLFALDLDYAPNKTTRLFEFGPPREVSLRYRLAPWCTTPKEVFRIDADGTSDVTFEVKSGEIEIKDTIHKVALYVVSSEKGLRDKLEKKRKQLLAEESEINFDPMTKETDLQKLVDFKESLPKD